MAWLAAMASRLPGADGLNDEERQRQQEQHNESVLAV